MRRGSLVLLVVCCGPHARPPPQVPPHGAPPPATVVAFEVHGEHGIEREPAPELLQPAHVKLRLGHYRDDETGVGLTIDRISAATDNVADVDPALVRFDGEREVWFLEGRSGAHGRTEYVRPDGRILLMVSRHGAFTVFVPDPTTDRTQAITVYRDGDAEPLTLTPGAP